MYYYFDDTINKIRYIILDNYDFYYSNNRYNGGTKMSQEQYDWLIDKLQINNYSILIVSHQTCDTTLSNYEASLEPLHKILEAFKNKTVLNYNNNDVILSVDFTNNSSDLIMHLAGHSHQDESHVENNVLCVTTVCDAYYQSPSGYTRNTGQITEQAFDIICIDLNNKRINMIRIGAGENRQFNY